MLTSSLFSGSADLNGIANGSRRMLAPEASDSVALVQEALVALGFGLPQAGIDGSFGAEMGQAVSSYKRDRGLAPSDPVVGPQTMKRLDLEISYLEGIVPDPSAIDVKAALNDPLFAGIMELQGLNPGIGQEVINSSGLGDRLCFRTSFIVESLVASHVGRFVEPFVFTDFEERCGRSPADFFDKDPSVRPYINFLLAHNPQSDPARIEELAGLRRPDILSHRAPMEWYEIKPFSISGAIAARIKVNSIIPNYASRLLPYLPGTAYAPSKEIVISKLITPEGEKLDVILELRREVPGLIFWTLCVKGDYVAYFNRVRLAAGILAILLAIGVELVSAAEAAALGEAIRALVVQFSIGVLPTLLPR